MKSKTCKQKQAKPLKVNAETYLRSLRSWVTRIADAQYAETQKAITRYAEIMAALSDIRANSDSELRKANEQLLGKIQQQAKTIHSLQAEVQFGWRKAS